MAPLPKGRSERELRQQLRQVTRSRDRLRQEGSELRQRLRELEAERERLRRWVAQQDKQIQDLKAKLGEAQRTAKRQAALFGRRKRKKNPKEPGHAAAQRGRPPEVDERVRVPLCACPDCGGPVRDVQDLESQIVIDVPEPVKPHVTEYTNQSGWCGKCHKRVQSRHRDQHSTGRGAAGVQIGPRALALAMDLRYRVGIVYRKVAGILELLLGIYVCAGALVPCCSTA